jgi:quinol monooxygenase YgiN
VRNEIYWLVTCDVKPGKFNDFTKVVEPLVAATKNEVGSIAYDYSVNDDETLVQIFETYTDSTAVVSHVTKVFSQFAADFSACVDVMGFLVFGEPDAAATEILDRFGATYMRPFEGFIQK